MGRRIKVAVRLRPSDRDQSCLNVDEKGNDVIVTDVAGTNASSIPHSFHVDQVIPENCGNVELFRNLVLERIHSSVKEPDTSCFLAYGHTNSGKTHTIAGTETEPGLLTLAARAVLDTYGTVEVAMLEVYGEMVNDLLAEGERRRIRRRSGPEGTVIVVEELTTCMLKSMEEWNAVSEFGMHTRRTAPTERNHRSSRSHALFTIKSHGLRLCLVDLAGSERQTTYSPQLNKESITINKSLSRLSTVLEALSTTRQKADGTSSYVNFRDSTLTVLLQRYLSGASMTVFLACVHPNAQFYQETMSTMRYTQRLKRIKTKNASQRLSEDMSLFQHGENKNLFAELLLLRKIVGKHRAKQQHLDLWSCSGPATGDHVDGGDRLPFSAHAVECPSAHHAEKTDMIRDKPRQRLMRSNETKRVAGWLLSRVLGDLPEFSVGFDDYFDSYFPPQVQVVGYVSLMACLPPRELHEDGRSLAFLDVGDIVMGLSMLDAGIPACVGLHQIGCNGFNSWEAHEYDETNKLFVLAFFEVSDQLVEVMGTSDDAFECCVGLLTPEPLVPLAVVLCTSHDAPDELKEAILHHLVALQGGQEGVLEKNVGDDGSMSSPYGETPCSRESTRRSKANTLREMTLWHRRDVEGGNTSSDSIKSSCSMNVESVPQVPSSSHSLSVVNKPECDHRRLFPPRCESASRSEKLLSPQPPFVPFSQSRDFAISSSSSSLGEGVDLPLDSSCMPFERQMIDILNLSKNQKKSSRNSENDSEKSGGAGASEVHDADDVIADNVPASHTQVRLSVLGAGAPLAVSHSTLRSLHDLGSASTADITSPSPSFPFPLHVPASLSAVRQAESVSQGRKPRASYTVTTSHSLSGTKLRNDNTTEKVKKERVYRKKRAPVLHGCHSCSVL